MIRRIGIDFGTSTTVLRVKSYDDDGRTPLSSNVLACDAVKFSGMDTVQSLVREWTANGQAQYACGAKASSDRQGSTLHTGFKMALEDPDAGLRERAWALTDVFFRYLYDTYHADDLSGSFGDAAEMEETWVSHPVKWSEQTAQRLAQSAIKAGFQNVHLMNEAQAAVTSVALRNAGQIRRDLGLGPEARCRVLLVDMGAGTTDLVLGDYIPVSGSGVEFETDICWPDSGSEPARGGQWAKDSAGFTCGGREFDQRLAEYMQNVLQKSGEPFMLPGGVEQIKPWKEQNLSPALVEDTTVSTFAPFEMFKQMSGKAIEFSLDRAAVLEIFAPELRQLIDLVNSCMAQTSEPYVDAVVLVGGGSQWFFVRDILSGKLSFEGRSVRLVRKNGGLPTVLPVHRPQETVAQGLVLAPLSAGAQDVQILLDNPEGTVGWLVISYIFTSAGFTDENEAIKVLDEQPQFTSTLEKFCEVVYTQLSQKGEARVRLRYSLSGRSYLMEGRITAGNINGRLASKGLPPVFPNVPATGTWSEDLSVRPLDEGAESGASAADGSVSSPVSGDAWRRDEYGQCLARRLTSLVNQHLSSTLKGNSFAKFASAMKTHADKILELLAQRDNIRVFMHHGDIYISGVVTRADCNEWAAQEDYDPPFPGETNRPDHSQIFSYKIRRLDAFSEIETVRKVEKDFLLTDIQRDDLLTAMRKLRKRTVGMRSKDEIVADGADTIPSNTTAYKRSAKHIDDLKSSGLGVYYCHPQSFLFIGLVVTEIGVFLYSTTVSDVDISLYSWLQLAMNGGADIRSHVHCTECGEQLMAVLDEFLARLKEEYNVDFYTDF